MVFAEVTVVVPQARVELGGFITIRFAGVAIRSHTWARVQFGGGRCWLAGLAE